MPVTRRRSARWFLLGVAWGLGACSSRPPAPDAGVFDSGFRDAGSDVSRDVAADQSTLDAAGTDARDESAAADGAGGDDAQDAPADSAPADDTPGGTDSGADDVVSVDAADDVGSDDVVPIFDAAGSDVHLPSSCEQDAAAMALCNSDPDCVAGVERCLPTGCAPGEKRCQRAGRNCLDGSDCLAGLQACVDGSCVATGSDCGDTRACPLGFLCEGAPGARTCVDRRRPCGTIDNLCPYNALCFAPRGGSAFCVAMATRCASDAACLPGAVCRDIDGDGQSECVPDGRCGPGVCNSDAGAQTCEVLPVELTPVCGPHGICSSSSPCATGYTCVDAWGTGVGECHLDADACHSHADCASGQLCYSADEEYQDGGASGCR